MAIEDGITPEQYVELISITVLTVSVDAFCASLGIDLRPLPKPQPVAPNIVRSLSLVPDEARGLQKLAQAEYLTFDNLVNFTAQRSQDRRQTEFDCNPGIRTQRVFLLNQRSCSGAPCER